ncbi:S8 family peptidase [Halanaerobium congolense]|uniref:S8 family peptidase n=1 Tax=Halanaerobium congolense TaxID=54121 RepID=UPI0011B1E88C|nr:S8 family peptidase [Halanaerobium congolense]
MLEEERVCQIDIPPKLMSEFHQKLDLDLDKLNPGEVEADSPAVCVIDSGIVPEHPLIRNTLVDSKVFREDLDDYFSDLFIYRRGWFIKSSNCSKLSKCWFNKYRIKNR